ncbi:MAG TPA: ATPase, T2SS/T4P/T4SS family, partial [Alphaproteobacteria bacterium]|nr:ATPase, T2SS/T4P/T4SS family [Alphaproteobacteria bacterium]
MFGRRSATPHRPAPAPLAEPAAARPAPGPAAPAADGYYEVKTGIFNALIESVDLTEIVKADAATVREELRDIVAEIISVRGLALSAAEQAALVEDVCNDVLGLGPLEPLLQRDDVADIMVNGHDRVYIETEGRIELTPVRFRDNAQLMNICQRIVSAVGRRVDEANPICDARLMDGSRVNVVVPPLSLDGPTLTIRKFR